MYLILSFHKNKIACFICSQRRVFQCTGAGGTIAYHRKQQVLINDGEIEQVRRGYYQRIDDNSYSEVAVIAFFGGLMCPLRSTSSESMAAGVIQLLDGRISDRYSATGFHVPLSML